MQISKEVIHREIAGEHILVPAGSLALRRKGVFVISELGAEIWEMLQAGKDRSAIMATLLDDYDVTEDVLAKDMDDFLQMLRENELLTD